MTLGDVAKKNVPKMCLIAPPAQGGHVSTRTFIPHRVHKAVGVFGAVSVATACVLPGSVATGVARMDQKATGARSIEVEHPTGFFSVSTQIEMEDGVPVVRSAALLRTARKLMTGEVYVPDEV
jgi:4-oxalomesaconate tautomerase